MWEVWSAGSDHKRPIDFADFEATGGLASALSNHADEIYDSLQDGSHRSVCAKVFKALTEKGDDNRGIRRPTRLAQLQAIAAADRATVTTVLDAFRSSGVTFLMPGMEVELGDRTVLDLSHESLMRCWQRLRGWVEDEAQSARIFRRLLDTARLWKDGKAGLFRDPDLQIALSFCEQEAPNAEWAEQYGGHFETAIGFLEASNAAAEAERQVKEAARQRELEQAQELAEARRLRLEQQQRAARKLRKMLAGLAGVAVVAVLACVAALIANQRANTQADNARQSEEKARQHAQRAEQSHLETANALAVVESQKTKVEASLSKAEAAERLARAAEEAGRKLLYVTDMRLAPFVWSDDRTTAEQLRALLAKHVREGEAPAEPESAGNKASFAAGARPDLRGFEWYYYQHLLESSATVFSGHGVPVVDSALTLKGQLVTLDQNGQVRRWDLGSQDEEKRSRRDLPGGPTAQFRVLSPDGRLVALASGNKVQVFDTSTGKETFQIDSPFLNRYRRLIFSRDSDRLVIVDNKIRWCNAVSGQEIATVNRLFDRIESLALTPDGLTLAVVGSGRLGHDFSIYRLDAKTQTVTPLAKDVGGDGTKRASALSQDGQRIAVGYALSGSLAVFDTTTGRFLGRHGSAHASPISAIAFSSDGAKLATGDNEATIKIWADVPKITSKSVAQLTLKGHQGAIRNVSFSSDGKRLVSGSADKTARVWDLETAGAAIRPLEFAFGRCDVACFSPDGQLIATSGGPSVRLWDAATGRLVRVLSAGDRSSIYSVAFSPTDHRLLAVGHGGPGAGSAVALWDIDAGRELLRLPGATDLPNFRGDENASVVGALAFSPDGKHLVAGFGNKHFYSPTSIPSPLKVWDVATRRLVRLLNGHTGYCLSLDFTRDGALLVSGSRDGTAILWSTRTWEATQTLQNPDRASQFGQQGRGQVEDVAFAPDGKTLALASQEGTVQLWDVATGKLLVSLPGHSSAVSAVVFSPDGRTLASGSGDETVRLWNVQTRRELMQLDPGTVDLGAVRTLAFSPDGKHLLAGANNRTAVWSAAPIVWNHPDLAADKLRLLLNSNADFQSRIRLLSENLRLHEALAKLDSKDVRVQTALAVTQANWQASRQAWPEAVVAFDRLLAVQPTEPEAWLRTPGLLRLATALLHQGRPAVATMLLQGGAGRRRQDGLPPITRTIGFGFGFVVEDGAVRVTEPMVGSPAARSNLRPGDVILKVNDVAMTKETSPNAARLLLGNPATKVRLTVRHPGSTQTEDIELVKQWYPVDRATGELLFPLRAALEKRLAEAPGDAGLIELSAELAGQESDFARQVADCTAAIKVLAEQPAEAASAALQRLHRLRGDACVSLFKWQEAVDDYSQVITPETTDALLLSKRARAQEALKNWDNAAADWSRAATGNPEGARWLAEFARRLAAAGQVPLAKGQFDRSQALYQRLLEAAPESALVAAKLAQLILDREEMENAARWTVLKPAAMKSEGGATLTKLDDHSILAGGMNLPRDVYVLTFRDLPARIQALRLEVLPHGSLPQNGPGRHTSGNFYLTAVKAQLDLPTNPGTPRPLKLARAAADFNQLNYSVAGAIDANDLTAWAILPVVGKSHLAVLELAEPVAATDGMVLRVTLEFKSRIPQAQLGRFRLSVSGDPVALDREQKRFTAMQATGPWARLAVAYRLVDDQQALDRLLKQHPAAAVGLGDLYTAAQDWERAIAEYRKGLPDQPADTALLTKLATAYQSAGRTREAVPHLATLSAANPRDSLLYLKVAGLQAWFGQEKEYAATRRQVLAFARGDSTPITAYRAAKACSLLPSTDKADLEAALALGRTAVQLGKGGAYNQLSLGMAEYRSGNYPAAEETLLAAAKASPTNPYVTSTSAFYRAMSLFRQGKPDEARKLVSEAAARMKPLPRDENNPLAGIASYNDLILWLACKEAKALIQ